MAFAISHKATTGPAGVHGWGLRQRVEGDITEWWYATEQERDAKLDAIVWWYWRANPSTYFSERTCALLDTTADLPPEWLRGRYRMGRTNEVPWAEESDRR